MADNRFYRPSDIDILRMENELLTHENSYLKARMSDPETQQRGPALAAAEYEQLRQAQNDLRWLLRRLGSSPVGPVLRRWPGWRTLSSRHLGSR